MSPASSAFSPTPPGHEDLSAKIVNTEGPLPMSSEPLILQASLVSQKMAPYLTHSLSNHHHHHHQDVLKKSKGKDAFAVAVPCIW